MADLYPDLRRVIITTRRKVGEQRQYMWIPGHWEPHPAKDQHPTDETPLTVNVDSDESGVTVQINGTAPPLTPDEAYWLADQLRGAADAASYEIRKYGSGPPAVIVLEFQGAKG
jgi:hypothetical protein